MKAFLKKLPNQTLIPDDQESADFVRKLKIGQVVSVEMVRPRKYEFHKKWFALVQVGFDYFEPETEYKGMPVEKNFERFRKDITILSGFYHMVPTVKGEPRAEADSISFANMTEDDFVKLYSATINTLLKYVCRNFTEDELVRTAQTDIMEFA